MPAPGNQPTDSGDSVRCSTCFESIRREARKCRACDSYQDWRRHLQIGSSVLALLVALVSVVALAAPLIVQTFKKDGSEIHVAFTGIAKNRAFFMATNSGNRPATVTGMRLVYSSSGNPVRIMSWNGEPTLVPAGSAKQVVFDFDGMRDLMSKLITARFADKNSAPFDFEFRTYAMEFNRHVRVFRYPAPMSDLALSGDGPLWRCFGEQHLGGRWTGTEGGISQIMDQKIGERCLRTVAAQEREAKRRPTKVAAPPPPGG